MKSRRKWLCLDCKVDTGKIGEFYFLKTELWLQAVGSTNGMLCIECLEKRIGRQLEPGDFTNCYLNNARKGCSQRLQHRLNGHLQDKRNRHEA